MRSCASPKATYAEHLVLALYVSAQAICVTVIAMALMDLAGAKTLAALWQLVPLAFYAWSLQQFTGARWPGVIARAVVAVMATAVAVLGAIGVGMALVASR